MIFKGHSVGFVLLLSEQGMHQWSSVSTYHQGYSSKLVSAERVWLQQVLRWL